MYVHSAAPKIPLATKVLALKMTERDGYTMSEPKRNLPITMVNVLVVIAILMILSALIVPIFVPPESRAASRSAAPRACASRAKR